MLNRASKEVLEKKAFKALASEMDRQFTDTEQDQMEFFTDLNQLPQSYTWRFNYEGRYYTWKYEVESRTIVKKDGGRSRKSIA